MEPAGFEEIEHTADWALRVWAPGLAELLATAARGMYLLAGTTFGPWEGEVVLFALEGEDAEMMLVNFLEELLFFGESSGKGAERFEMEIAFPRLAARVFACEILAQKKEIKAVTYHDLVVRETEDGFETTIVFDV